MIVGNDIDGAAERLTCIFGRNRNGRGKMFRYRSFLLFDKNTRVDSGTQNESYKSLYCTQDSNPKPNKLQVYFPNNKL